MPLERSGVVLAGLAATALGATVEGVYSLVRDASAFGSAGSFIVAMVGMFSRIGGHDLLGLDYPYLVSLALSAAACFVASTRTTLRPLGLQLIRRDSL